MTRTMRGLPPRPVPPDTFGWRLRGVRLAAGLSLRQLADLVGVSHQALAVMERGEGYPASSTLVALGRALDVSIDFLMLGHREHRVEPDIGDEP